MAQLRDFLLQLVDSPPALGSAQENIRAEASAALACGLRVFYPSADDQIGLILSLLQSEPTSSARAALLQQLLSALSEWYLAPHHLLASCSAAASPIKSSTSSESPAAPVPAASGQEQLRPHLQQLLFALLKRAVSEVASSLEHMDSDAFSPHMSPSVRLLLSFHRELASSAELRPLLLSYTAEAFRQLQELVAGLLERKAEAARPLPQLLESSPLSTLVPSLATLLSRKDFSGDLHLAAELFPPLLRLLRSVDQAAESLHSAVHEADARYVRNLSRQEPKKVRAIASIRDGIFASV